MDSKSCIPYETRIYSVYYLVGVTVNRDNIYAYKAEYYCMSSFLLQNKNVQIL